MSFTWRLHGALLSESICPNAILYTMDAAHQRWILLLENGRLGVAEPSTEAK